MKTSAEKISEVFLYAAGGVLGLALMPWLLLFLFKIGNVFQFYWQYCNYVLGFRP